MYGKIWSRIYKAKSLSLKIKFPALRAEYRSEEPIQLYFHELADTDISVAIQ